MRGKKILIFIGAFVLILGIVLVSAYVTSTPQKGLVGHWALDEEGYNSATGRITDKSGSENHGTITGALVPTTDRNGQSNRAMDFDGTNDEINLDSIEVLAHGSWTISYWFTQDADNNMIIGRGAENYNRFYHRDYSLASAYIRLHFDAGTYEDLDFGQAVNSGWHHVVVTANGNTVTMYTDGVQTDTGTDANNAFEVETIGDAYTGNTYRWDGKIAEVRIYNIPLNVEEAKSLYDSYRPKTSAGSLQNGLIGYYVLDQESYNPSTNRTTDKTPYGNHGTSNGTISFTTDRNGQSGRAMTFDGTENYIGMDYNSNMDTCSITVAAWVKPADSGPPSDTDRIVSRDRSDYWMLGQDSNNGIEWTITEGGMRQYFSATNVMTAGEWSFVVGTYDGTTGDMNAYVDGVQVIDQSPTTCSGVIGNANNRPLGIGTNVESTPQGPYWFNGDISDVRIYNRALSADELDILYNSYRPKASAGSLHKGLILDVPLKSKYMKSATLLTDKTPYSNDGTNSGATVGVDSTNFDGNGDVVEANGYTYVFGTELTLASWFKYSGAGVGAPRILELSILGDATSHALAPDGDGSLRAWAECSTGRVASADDSTQYDDGNWHHMAYTYSSPDSIMYVDGVQTDTGSGACANLDDTLYTAIGAISDVSGGFSHSSNEFDGDLSGARVYNRALTSEEIKLLYDKGR